MKTVKLSIILTLAAWLVGCSSVPPTTFIHPGFDFAYVEKVAVIPFENLSNDQGAGARASWYFIAELLATEAFDVVEPGEVARALEKYSLVRTADLTQEQMVDLGQRLQVQGLFMGSVNESSTSRSGGTEINVVTLTARLVETDVGTTVWSSTNTMTGKNFWSSLFGTASKSKSEVTRMCVDQSLGTLVK